MRAVFQSILINMADIFCLSSHSELPKYMSNCYLVVLNIKFIFVFGVNFESESYKNMIKLKKNFLAPLGLIFLTSYMTHIRLTRQCSLFSNETMTIMSSVLPEFH